MVLANALYFKGMWKKSFDTQSTALKCFRSMRKACVNAAMMQSTDIFNYRFIEALDAQALELPYSVSYLLFILITLRFKPKFFTGWKIFDVGVVA